MCTTEHATKKFCLFATKHVCLNLKRFQSVLVAAMSLNQVATDNIGEVLRFLSTPDVAHAALSCKLFKKCSQIVKEFHLSDQLVKSYSSQEIRLMLCVLGM